MLKYFYLLFIIFLLTGCGGSSGSDNNNPPITYPDTGIWYTPESIDAYDDVTGSSSGARIATDVSGNAIAVWQRYDGANTNIWVNHYKSDLGWGGAQIIDSNDGVSHYPDIGLDNYGNATVVWSGSDYVWARRYEPDTGWNAPVVIGSTEHHTIPDLSVNPGGDAIVVWNVSSGDSAGMWSNRFTISEGWGAPEKIGIGSGVEDLSVAIDHYGNGIAVWTQTRASPTYGKDIWVNYYTVGAGWQGQPVQISSGITDETGLRIAVNSDGNAILVSIKEEWGCYDTWMFGTVCGSQDNIVARYYTKEAGWGGAQQLSYRISNGDDARQPQIAMDANGNAIAVWSQGAYFFGYHDQDNIYASRFTPETSWSAAERIDKQLLSGSDSPQICFDADGNAMAVWADHDGHHGLLAVFANQYTVGAGWGEATYVEDMNAGSVSSPQIAIDDSGNALVVWAYDESYTDQWNIWANRFELSGSQFGSSNNNSGWITIDEPDSSSYVVENADRIQLSGKMFQSHAGVEENGDFVFALTVTVTNLSTGFKINARLYQPDAWTAVIPLTYGDNQIEVYVEDANGINAREGVLIERRDTIPPVILSKFPENNAINVATTTDVIMTLSEPLDKSGITSSNIFLSLNGTRIEGAFTYDDDTYELVISPIEPLLYNTTYTVEVNSDLTDLQGNNILAQSFQFTTIPMASIPVTQTGEVTDIGEISAKVWGNVSPNYAETEAWFEWGTDNNFDSYSATEKIVIQPLSGMTNISSEIGLDPGIEYYYRIVASNSAGISRGEVQSFFTFGPPAVMTYQPLLLSPSQVKLFGSVNPNGYNAEALFKLDYQPNITYSSRSSQPIQLGDGHQSIDVEHEFDQLASGSIYYYRLDASFLNGTVSSDVVGFTTPYSTSSCWVKRYHPPASILVGAENETGFDEIISIDQTMDDGYIIIMESLSYEDGRGGTRGMRVLKTNSDGGVEWVRRYSSSSSHKVGYNITAIRQTGTGNYIVAGYYQTAWSLSFSNEVAWIAELDQSGDIVWEKRYGDTYFSRDSNWYHPTNIFLLPDGYIVFGTYYGTYEGTSTWMIKLDTTGQPVWSKNYSGRFEVITQVPGGFAMASTTGSGFSDYDMLVRLIDMDGQVQLSKHYDTNLDAVRSIAVSSGTLAILGTVTAAGGASDIRVFGIDANGNISWEYTFDGGYNDSAASIRASSDGGFIVGANTDINESDKGVVLLKLSLTGVLQWQKVYPDKSIPNDHDTLRTVSGGDYIVGVRSIPSQVNTFELIKTDSSGSCSTLDSPSSMISSLSESTITDYVESSGSGDPTYIWNSTSYQFGGYAEIEQIYP